MKKLSLIILCLFSLHLNAQNLEQKIPDNAGVVVSLNGANLDQNFSLNDIQKLDISKKLNETIASIPQMENNQDLSKMGVDVKKNLYFFMQLTDSVSYFNFYLPLNDAGKLKSILSELGELKTDKNGNSYASMGNGIFSINGNEAYMVMAEIDYSYYNNHPELAEKYGVQEGYSGKKELSALWAVQLAEQTAKGVSNSVTKLPSFQTSKLSDYDLGIWVNSSAITAGQLTKLYRPMMPFYNSFSGLLKGNAAWYGLNFEKQQVVLEIESYMNKKFSDYTKSILKGTVNPKFAQYADSKEPLAYYSVAMDMKAAVKNFQSTYGDAINEIPEYGQMANDVWSLLIDVLIDEDAVFDVFQANAMFVVKDIRPMEIKYVTYEYDDDYNSKEVEHTKTETLPVYTFMMGTDKVYMDKMINILRVSRMLDEKDGYYKVTKGSSSFPTFITTKDDILFVSNDESGIKKIASGSKMVALDKSHANLTATNNQVAYINLKSLLEKMPVSEMGMNEREKQMYQLSMDHAEEFVMTGAVPTANGFKTVATLKVPNKKVNSLEVLIQYVNEMYKIEKGLK